MKLIATGDNHFDASSHRWAECLRIHTWIAELVERECPAAFLCGGDIYERASTPEERLVVARWLERIADVCPVVITKGNHDRHQDLELLARLKTRHLIHVVEDARVVCVGEALIACVAWPDRAQLLAAAHAEGLAGDHLEHVALRTVLTGLGHELDHHEGPCIALGHFMVDGAVTSVGQPLVGHAMNVGLADLGQLGAELVLMSHIHAPQEWTWGGSRMVYMGSPFRTSYGETEQKSVVLAEFDGNALTRFERVPTPCAGMVLLEDEWGWLKDSADDADGGHYTWLVGLDGYAGPASVRGAECRFRYKVDADQRDAARTAAQKVERWLLDEQGAIAVKLDERVRPTTRARAPEVAQASTLAEKMVALWNARGTTPAPERAERLTQMAEQLEQESAA